jgi:hypothetical protein
MRQRNDAQETIISTMKRHAYAALVRLHGLTRRVTIPTPLELGGVKRKLFSDVITRAAPFTAPAPRPAPCRFATSTRKGVLFLFLFLVLVVVGVDLGLSTEFTGVKRVFRRHP